MKITFHDMGTAACHVRINDARIPLYRERKPRSDDGRTPPHYVWSGVVKGRAIRGTNRTDLRRSIEAALKKSPAPQLSALRLVDKAN